MDPIASIIRMLIDFLLRLLELFIGFFIAALQLVLEFARAVAGSIQ